MDFNVASLVFYISSFSLILLGLYAILVKKNLIKIVLGMSLLDSGVNILIVSLGYIKDKTAPIFSQAGLSGSQMVDPVPQALVLTAIVIGLAVTALALTIVIRLFEHHKTLNISKIRELKW
jgi:multicomponent Na+:H+ antiporter subunit C